MNIESRNLLWHATFPSRPKNEEAVASSCLNIATTLRRHCDADTLFHYSRLSLYVVWDRP